MNLDGDVCAGQQSLRDVLIVEGRSPGAYALVHLDEFSSEPGLYVVLTTAAAHHLQSFTLKLKAAIAELAPHLSVVWVRPLNTRLQRLFGWGDVTADRATVERLVSKARALEDPRIVAEVLPYTAPLVSLPYSANVDVDRILDLLPHVADLVLKNAHPSIPDCQHDFSVFLPGPCSRADCRELLLCNSWGLFGRCSGCGTVWCHICMKAHASAEWDRLAVMRLLHEARDEHVWVEAKHTDCTACGELGARVCSCGGQRCLACLHKARGEHDWVDAKNGSCAFCDQQLEDEVCRCARCTFCDEKLDVKVCRCGARRCAACLAAPSHPAGTPDVKWGQDQHRPLPFFVVDLAKISVGEKLAFIKQELGMTASLPEVAAKYVELFGAKQRDAAQQKLKALELWKQYSGTAYAKTCDIPPAERTDFLRIWHPDYPDLCVVCAANSSFTRGGQHYCSAECVDAGTSLVCTRCAREANVLDGLPYCRACDGHVLPIVGDDPVAQSRRETRRSLGVAEMLWFNRFRRTLVPGTDMWKRRRRA